MYLFILPLLLFNCTKTEIEEVIKEVEVERIVTNTVIETVTVTSTVVIAPEEYSFTRNGVSTVYYTGQAARLKMATELKSAMNNLSSTQIGIDKMFNQGKGFSDSSLDASGKKVGNKTAASPIASATV